MPLSLDLRERVVGAIHDGMGKTKAAKIFGVARRSIYNWLELHENTNSLKAKTNYQKGHSHKITDWEKFKIFVEEHKQKTVPIMVKEYEKLTGVQMCDTVMEKALKKINYSCKKKRFIM